MSSRDSSALKLTSALGTFSLLVLSPALVMASPGGAGLPWETSFETIEQSVLGVAPHLLAISIVIAALALMFGEGGGMSRRVVNIVVGGATVVGVGSVVTTLFEGGGGLLL
jgi:type IV secretory pathway VirB2 component (pilin)